MRAFVTGASGFIGQVLCPQLSERGREVSALVGRPRSASARTKAVRGDLRDEQSVVEALASERPDWVFHLVAEIASQRSARRVHEVDALGTRRLVDARLALAGTEPGSGPRIVFASTVVTGEASGTLLTEDTQLPVHTPYGRSKQECERLILQSVLPAVVIRPSHVYGPGGWYANKLVARRRGPGRLAVIARGENMWDVVHVHDVAAALLLAAERARGGVDLSRGRRPADRVLRVHGVDCAGARGAVSAACSRGLRSGDRGAQRGRRGCPLRSLPQCQDQAGAWLAAPVSERAGGRGAGNCGLAAG